MKSYKTRLRPMTIHPILVAAIFFAGITNVFSQADKRIDEIRKIYQDVNIQAAECDRNGDTSTTFLTEMVVNKNDGAYPAVGIYKTVVKFYYTFGDREKDPYPNRLLKISATTNRSAMTETSEYLFDPAGQLIFYFEKKDEVERRIYFAKEKPIRILKGEKSQNLNSKTETELVRSVLARTGGLVKTFSNSLEF